MKTLSHIIALVAILIPVMASANNYENRVKEALELIAQKANSCSSIGLTYNAHNDPETGPHEGKGGAVSPPELAERTRGTEALGES